MDLEQLWDFAHPAVSAERFAGRVDALALDDPRGADLARTQLARALGLQEQYADALAVLDQVTGSEDPEVRTRAALERGRVLRSSGEPDGSAAYFEEAVDLARDAGLEALHVDALHMLALLPSDPAEQLRLNEEALAAARASTEPRARDWDASLLNNLGMARHELGDLPGALATFTEALAACERIGKVENVRIARWMIGWTLRLLGRRQEAMAIQQALAQELRAAGEDDPYVRQELALLLAEEGPGDPPDATS